MSHGYLMRTAFIVTVGIQHFDISYWAFEQLAHPLFGLMNLEFKTVDCDTGADLPYGYVNKDVIYGSGGTEAGWSWFPYQASYSEYAIPGRCLYHMRRQELLERI